jgi:hypothetical protein
MIAITLATIGLVIAACVALVLIGAAIAVAGWLMLAGYQTAVWLLAQFGFDL